MSSSFNPVPALAGRSCGSAGCLYGLQSFSNRADFRSLNTILMGRQLSLITSSTPMLRPKSGREPYEGSGEQGQPWFGNLCDRNRKQVKWVYDSIKTAGGFSVGDAEQKDDFERLVRRNIIGRGYRGGYTVSREQRAEMGKFLGLAPTRYGMKNYVVNMHGPDGIVMRYHFWMIDGSRSWIEDLTIAQAKKYRRVQWVSPIKAQSLGLL